MLMNLSAYSDVPNEIVSAQLSLPRADQGRRQNIFPAKPSASVVECQGRAAFPHTSRQLVDLTLCIFLLTSIELDKFTWTKRPQIERATLVSESDKTIKSLTLWTYSSPCSRHMAKPRDSNPYYIAFN
ncbi:unnamed protein product [Arctia plantaginis]|uniref:Uncharacterized protein n=1 Tax=Arctia plantaginis TaxID=874455 RepID=A0A8S0ZF61_ARCPL|nr:unnamed protein product [Arctia plantaginis]